MGLAGGGFAGRFEPVVSEAFCFGIRSRGARAAFVQEPDETSLPGSARSAHPEITTHVVAEGQRILDVGCGAGAMGAALLEQGAREVVGIEWEQEAALVARHRMTAVYAYDVERMPSLPYRQGYFDVLTLAGTLSRLYRPEAVVRHLLGWLKPGGILIGSVPNLRHERRLRSLLIGDEGPRRGEHTLEPGWRGAYTWTEIVEFCRTLGLSSCRRLGTIVSQSSEAFETLCQLVSRLGVTEVQFRQDALITHYVFSASVAADASKSAVPPLPDPWRGSRPTRLLLVPVLSEAADDWQEVIRALASMSTLLEDTTVGIALPRALLAQPPVVIHEAAATGRLDLVLMDVPGDAAGKARVLAGATAFINTCSRGEMRAIAEDVGTPVLEGATLLSDLP